MQTFDFTIGTKVYCEDGECGRLAKAVVDPNTLELKGIVVEAGTLLDESRVFPLGLVTDTSPDEIQLAIPQGELNRYPPYDERLYEPLTNLGQQSSPNGSADPTIRGGNLESVVAKLFDIYPHALLIYEKNQHELTHQLSGLSHGTCVYAQDGEVARLDSFLTDPERGERITHIVVRQGFLVPEYIPVPLTLVQQVDQAGIHLATTREGLVGLTRYAWSQESEGHQGSDNVVPSPNGLNKGKILSHDLALRAIVANALSQDDETRNAVIEVVNEQGIITLLGTVENKHIREMAQMIASQQPGVISVINSLKVKPTKGANYESNERRIEPLIHPYAIERPA